MSPVEDAMQCVRHDRRSGIYGPRLHQAHHKVCLVTGLHVVAATIVAARDKPIVCEELADVLVLPVGTFVWPFPANERTNGPSSLHDGLGTLPKLPKHTAMLCDLRPGLVVALRPVEVRVGRASCAREGEPYRIRGTLDARQNLLHRSVCPEVIVRRDSQDIATFCPVGLTHG